MTYEGEVDTPYWLTGLRGGGADVVWLCAACGEPDVRRETCLYYFSCAGSAVLFELPERQTPSSADNKEVA
jgi:hypothetical protein